MCFLTRHKLIIQGSLWLVIISQMVILMVVSQTGIIVGDEGLYLLAAQLVNAGKTPYIDFFYQHTPLYLYVFALWMRLFGESWRSAHLLAAILMGISIILVGNMVVSRLRSLGGYQVFALTTVWFMGCGIITLLYGTMALPYSMAICLIVIAFLLTLKVVNHSCAGLPIVAGLCASAAAMSTLLAMPACIVLMLWMVRYSCPGVRLRRWLQFCSGAAIPLLLLLWLAIQGPRQVLFDLVEYQLFYRRTGAGWTDIQTIRWDIKVLISWFQSTQAMILCLLSLLGMLFLGEFGGQNEYIRREFTLCGWLIFSLGLFASIAFPTFQQYYIFTVPFLSILASIGAYAISSRILPRFPKILLVLVFIVIFTFDSIYMAHQYSLFGKYMIGDWKKVEDIADAVSNVANRGRPVYASEAVYFAGQIMPEVGLENSFTALLPSNVANIPQLHIISQSKIDDLLRLGYYGVIVIDNDDERVFSLGLDRLYRFREELHGKLIFWN